MHSIVTDLDFVGMTESGDENYVSVVWFDGGFVVRFCPFCGKRFEIAPD